MRLGDYEEQTGEGHAPECTLAESDRGNRVLTPSADGSRSAAHDHGIGRDGADDGQGPPRGVRPARPRHAAEPCCSTRPYGFQANAASSPTGPSRTSASRSAARVEVAELRRTDTADRVAIEQAFARDPGGRLAVHRAGQPLVRARAMGAAPRCPTCWPRSSASSGALVFASAAALTLGVVTVPVYEIYKVGADPCWLDGLDLLSALGLPVGGDPRTSTTPRAATTTPASATWARPARAARASELPAGRVRARRRRAHRAHHRPRCRRGDHRRARRRHVAPGRPAGRARGGPDRARWTSCGPVADDVSRVDRRRARRPAHHRRRRPTRSGRVAGRGSTPGARADFDAALGVATPTERWPPCCALDEAISAWSTDTFQSDETDRARAALRSMIVRLGQAAQAGLRDPRAAWRPLVRGHAGRRAPPLGPSAATTCPTWSATSWPRRGVEVRDTPDGVEWVRAQIGFVIAPVSAPCTSRAYLASTPGRVTRRVRRPALAPAARARRRPPAGRAASGGCR